MPRPRKIYLMPVRLSGRHFGEGGYCLNWSGLSALASGERVDMHVFGPCVASIRSMVLCEIEPDCRLVFADTVTGSLFDATTGFGWPNSKLRIEPCESHEKRQ